MATEQVAGHRSLDLDSTMSKGSRGDSIGTKNSFRDRDKRLQSKSVDAFTLIVREGEVSPLSHKYFSFSNQAPQNCVGKNS